MQMESPVLCMHAIKAGISIINYYRSLHACDVCFFNYLYTCMVLMKTMHKLKFRQQVSSGTHR